MNGTQAAKGGGRLSFEVRDEAAECEMEPKLVTSWAKWNRRVPPLPAQVEQEGKVPQISGKSPSLLVSVLGNSTLCWPV